MSLTEQFAFPSLNIEQKWSAQYCGPPFRFSMAIISYARETSPTLSLPVLLPILGLTQSHSNAQVCLDWQWVRHTPSISITLSRIWFVCPFNRRSKATPPRILFFLNPLDLTKNNCANVANVTAQMLDLSTHFSPLNTGPVSVAVGPRPRCADIRPPMCGT